MITTGCFMKKTIFISGINGFIGSSLLEHMIHHDDYFIFGVDIDDSRVCSFFDHSNFKFIKDSISNLDLMEDLIRQSDIILPLAAIANPKLYVTDPLKVFALDFEANLELIKLTVKHQKRLIFPSTSEVYGMCQDQYFDEDQSNCVTGPIHKQRWIYSSSKQLLDRVIYAYGIHNNLDYTLFRPFNWVGGKLDSIDPEASERSRVVSKMISDIVFKKELTLVDGGKQKRAFTDIDDGIDALWKIIDDSTGSSYQKIFNIGNPFNEHSIKDLACYILDALKNNPKLSHFVDDINIIDRTGFEVYGQHYQDVDFRMPSINAIQECLGWKPSIDLKTSIEKIIQHHEQSILNDY